MSIMELEQNKKCFTLFETNGRRADIINAYSIYLDILDKLYKEYPSSFWAKYPNSFLQYEFYKRAIGASPKVFKKHSTFDKMEPLINKNKKLFYAADEDFCKSIGLFPFCKENSVWKDYDVNIENRARQYTRNLVLMGFATPKRQITEVGYEYLSKQTIKDRLEELLPLSDFNIILLRQIMKLKIFTEADENGNRRWYSPFFYCLKLLLEDEKISKSMLKSAVLSTNPYDKDDEAIIEVPEEIQPVEKLDEQVFKKCFTSRKSNDYQKIYYSFYNIFYDFYYNQDEKHYKILCDFYFTDDNKVTIDGTFLNENSLSFGKRNNHHSFDKFKESNKDSIWFNDSNTFNRTFYEQFSQSKAKRLIKEYGDTLFRILTATGLFNFSNALPELRYKDVIVEMLNGIDMDSFTFGQMSNDEYLKYEDNEKSYFGSKLTLIDIFNYTDSQVDTIINTLRQKYGSNIIEALRDEKSKLLKEHIEAKYPKDKIIELLGYFKGTREDNKIKRYVDSQATVPTIYEYITAIAWYYISNKDFSIYDSLNLSLDGNLEPLEHAQGGAGDIVINYDDKVIMLEVTLMNKAAQKRGEWEPVLRHSVNLKVENETKEVTTLFIADELDFNTVNIWRAVATVPLESTNGQKRTKNVYIMPFTNDDIISYLSKEISSKKIIESIRQSYSSLNTNFDELWREKIIENIYS